MTDEGTWMAIDVAPNDQTIIFELLGDIYELPRKGGQARPLTEGNAFESQARFSPNGQQILYVGDESGSDNLWVMDANGENKKQLTNNQYDLMITPEWSADGTTAYVTRVSEGFRRMATIHAVNMTTGEMTKLVDNTNGRPSGLVSAPGPGAYMSGVHPQTGLLYFSSVTPRAYNSRSGASSEIKYFDPNTGSVDKMILEGKGALKPIFSKDGKFMVYGANSAGESGLRLRDMVTGEEKWLLLPFVRNELDARATRDFLPNYAFSADGKYLLANQEGKIVQVALADGTVTNIPFEVAVNIEVPAPLQFDHKISDDPVTARFIHQPSLAKDGSFAFSALGQLYLMQVDQEKPLLISKENDRAYFPAWAPDGSFLVYATWNQAGGQLMKYDLQSKETIQLTQSPAFYAGPVVHPNGTKVLATRSLAILKHSAQFQAFPVEGSFVEIDLNTKKTTNLGSTNGAQFPQYVSDDGSFMAAFASTVSYYPSPGRIRKIVASGAGPIKLSKISPKGDALLVMTMGGTLHQVNFDTDSTWAARKQPLSFNPFEDGELLEAAIPEDFGWSSDGTAALWTKGTDYIIKTTGEKVNKKIQLQLPPKKDKGYLVLTGATTITMNGDEIIENAQILVNNNRIEKIGAKGSFPMPYSARVIDVTGKYIMPGIVDVHAHLRSSPGALNPVSPAMYSNLAYGTTSSRDPQAIHEVFIYGDMVNAGLIHGPRIFSTGPGFFFWDQYTSYEKLKSRLEIYKNRFGTNYIKSYLLGNRQQRKWMIQACKELELMPTAEGGADAKQGITHALDGFSGNEHSLPQDKIYKDVVELFAQSNINYTPTLLVTFGGPLPIYKMLADENPFADEKLQRFFPKESLYEKGAERLLFFRDEEYTVAEVSKGANAINMAGGNVVVGGHGEMQGIQNHWEMWLLAQGGMGNHNILKAATINGAKTLGLTNDLGSIEIGKLADMIVLNKNPLENIKNAINIQYVIKDGVVYEGNTLQIIHPEGAILETPWWQLDKK
ncbi:MAG: amidohydrolase family protein [Saprospiraceae bacterium]